MKSRVLRTLMPRKARHAVSCDTYAPTALLKCFSSILIRYQYNRSLYRKIVAGKAFAAMKKDGSIVSPIRCKWEPAQK